MYTMRREKVNGRGFLRVPEHWSPETAEALAEAEGVELTETHWQVIRVIRTFFEEHHVPPSYHVLRQQIKDTGDPFKYNCVLAMKQLFPRGGIKQASRIAGLPDYFCFGC